MRVCPDSLNSYRGSSKLFPYPRISDKEELLVGKVQAGEAKWGRSGEIKGVFPCYVRLSEAGIGDIYEFSPTFQGR